MPHRKLTGLPRLAFGVVPTLVLVLGLVRWRIANTPRTHLAGGRVVDVRTKGLNNTVTWIKTTADTSGEYIRFSPVIGPTAQGALPGKPASPPIHAHDKQVECFEVVRGTMAYLLDGIEGLVGPQDTVADPLCVPPGVPHTFWIGDNTTELEIIVNLSPALHGEKFFRTLAGFQADFESNVSILQALLTLAHGDVRPAEIPKNVWGAVAPVLEVVARHVLGFQPFYAEYTRLQ